MCVSLVFEETHWDPLIQTETHRRVCHMKYANAFDLSFVCQIYNILRVLSLCGNAINVLCLCELIIAYR